jgi:two-component SAPR family response regulator
MPLPNHNASPEFGPSSLPTAARFADAGPPARPPVSRGGSMPGGPGVSGRRVLVVEDEFVIALDLQLALYRLGCEVLGPVASVAEALVLLRHERPDAAVLDINLRDGLVTPVAQQLIVMGVPFVLVTARDTRHLADGLLRNAPTLGKPVSEEMLRRGILRLL